MSQWHFNGLLDLLKDDLERETTPFREPISNKDRLAVCLRIGKSTVSQIIPQVCDALWRRLQPLYLAPPTEEDWLEVAAGFQDRWDFPNCVGALDGKHVAIQAPPNSGSTFFNYKGGFSIVLMALVDHRYCFTVVEIGSHGSSSDGGIFRSSDLGKALQRGDLHLPGPRPLPGTEQPVPHVIVGDEAFPLQNNLMRPYPGRQLDEPRRIFNYRLSRARRVVENSFGILASKWEIYQRRIKLQPHNIDKVIKATCVLHNYLIKTLSLVSHPAPEARAEARAGGVERLQPCGNHPSREAFNLREIYKDYFMSTGKVKWQHAACFGVAAV
ncbi:hypothetical protein SKAU_G00208490 [Synaphobranchus kaupii]|uniref:DDE Tnp4 domain-containing protein n=1 Tax=Synaphobranchus kaupii TaxID=118154 RepID=A0A9Q1ITT0_SYNKA|nr:hypothetical protein SKAU_G00208470 [Synaphobranchus kaupii]KAJ8353282.1 hypothetical protein SKAU_G00208490 [Synaphobranchus kaupii]